MPNFRRSLSYLWQYRTRLAIAVLCVVGISIFWFSGLGMIGPLSRVMIDEEGLHGWAWSRIAEDRWGAKLSVSRRNPDSAPHLPDIILAASSVAKDGPAAKAGIDAFTWIIDIGSEGGAPVRGDELLRAIANDPSDTIAVRVYNLQTRREESVDLQLNDLKWHSRALSRVVSLLPAAPDRQRQVEDIFCTSSQRFWLPRTSATSSGSRRSIWSSRLSTERLSICVRIHMKWRCACR